MPDDDWRNKIERGPDGRPLYWIKGMQQCDCGTPDEGRHIKYKWPCRYYRKPTDDDAAAAGTNQRGLGSKGGKKGGRGGRKGGRGGRGQFANLSEAQMAALALPNVGWATNADHGDGCYIHPHNKRPCGTRLGNSALAIVYNKSLAWKSPTYSSAAATSIMPRETTVCLISPLI